MTHALPCVIIINQHTPNVLRMAHGICPWRSTPALVTNIKRLSPGGHAAIRLWGPSRSVGRGPLLPFHLRRQQRKRGAAYQRYSNNSICKCRPMHCKQSWGRGWWRISHRSNSKTGNGSSMLARLLEGKAVVPVQQHTASTPASAPGSVAGSRKSALTTCCKQQRQRQRQRQRQQQQQMMRRELHRGDLEAANDEGRVTPRGDLASAQVATWCISKGTQ